MSNATLVVSADTCRRSVFNVIEKRTQLQKLQLEHVQCREKIVTTLLVNDKEVKFEIDSGAAVSLMTESLARKLFPNSSILQD